MLAQFEENIQTLPAGKFAVKFAIRFVRIGEIAELSCDFLHAEIIALAEPESERKIIIE